MGGCGGKKGSGSGCPPPCLPEGEADGQLLQWHQGAWEPVADPSAIVGASNALLIWDAANGVWAPLQGGANGQILVWDAASASWVLSTPAGVSHMFGALSFGNVTTGALNTYTGESPASAFASRSIMFQPIAGPVRWRRIGYRVLTGTTQPSNLTLEVRINDIVQETLVVAQAITFASKVIDVPSNADDQLGVTFSLDGATDSTTRRPRLVIYGTVV